MDQATTAAIAELESQVAQLQQGQADLLSQLGFLQHQNQQVDSFSVPLIIDAVSKSHLLNILPSQSGNAGTVLATNGVNLYWFGLPTASVPYGRMSLASSQSPASATPTKVLLDTTTLEFGITADPITNHRFTVVTAGVYFIHGQVGYQSYVTGSNLVAEVYINGSQTVYSLAAGFNSGQLATVETSDLVHLNVGDYIELYTFHTFGSPAALENSSAITFLDITFIST